MEDLESQQPKGRINKTINYFESNTHTYLFVYVRVAVVVFLLYMRIGMREICILKMKHHTN